MGGCTFYKLKKRIWFLVILDLHRLEFCTQNILMCLVITDIDECSDWSLNDCDSKAACVDTVGSFQCHCLSGFSGDGTNCSGTTYNRL